MTARSTAGGIDVLLTRECTPRSGVAFPAMSTVASRGRLVFPKSGVNRIALGREMKSRNTGKLALGRHDTLG